MPWARTAPTVSGMTGNETRDAELKKELSATLQARRELGEEYESALVDSFLEKVEQRLDGAVDRGVRRRLAEQQVLVARGGRPPRSSTDSWGDRFGFGIVSLVLAVPLSAIGGGVGELPGLLITWVGILGVNAAWALRTSPHLGRRGSEPGAPDDTDWDG